MVLLLLRFGFGLVLCVVWGAAGNGIRAAGGTAVAEALKTNSTLSSLDLTCECVVCGLAMIVGGGCAQGGRQRVAGRGRRSNCGLDDDWWRRWAAGCGCAGEAGAGGRRDVAGEVGWCGVCGGALCAVWWRVQVVVGVAE